MKVGTPATLVGRIEARILLMRGERVMLDADLAERYGVATKVLVQAVKRNAERFPLDFMFQLTLDEFANLRSQIVTSSWGGRRYPPYAFTEHGVAMLSSVLNSGQAIQVNVEIVRAFVRLRRLLGSHEDLARKLAELEKRYDAQFRAVFDAIRQLMAPPEKAWRPLAVPRNASRCPCRISLSPHRLPGRGGGTVLSGEEGAAKGLTQPRRRLLTQQTRLPESPLCRMAQSPS